MNQQESMIEGIFLLYDDRYIAVYDGRIVAVGTDEAEVRRAWYDVCDADPENTLPDGGGMG